MLASTEQSPSVAWGIGRGLERQGAQAVGQGLLALARRQFAQRAFGLQHLLPLLHALCDECRRLAPPVSSYQT